MGKPKDESSFRHFKSGDIDTFIAAGIGVRNNKLNIKLRKFLWTKSLTTEGIVV